MDGLTTKLVETIYTNNRMLMEFFMPLPEATYTNKDKDGVRFFHSPIIQIRCKVSDSTRDIYDYMKAAFSVTVNNHLEVIKFFNTLMKWLFDDEFNDLFLMGPTNELMFNSDYKSLKTSVMFYSRKKTDVLYGVPSIVDLGEKLYEGVNLFVNTTDYMIPLTFREVGIIFGILKEFNFSSEVTKLLLMYDYVKKTDRIHPSRSEVGTPFDQ